MINRRSLLLSGGGLAAAATLAACGDNNPLASSSPSADGSGTPSAQGSGTATAGGKASLTQWYHEYGEAGVKEAVEGYASDYKDASVKVQWTPGEYQRILGAALLTAEAPDVFEFEQGGSLDMIRSGQLADLTDIFAPVKDQFNKAVVERFTFQDKIYAIPQVIDMQLLYYRKSALQEKGIEPPTSFDALAKAAQAVKSSDMGGFFAGNDSGVGVLGTLFIWASGNDQLDDARTEAAFLNDDFYQALVAYRDLVKSGAVVSGASNDWYGPEAFVNGEAAMQWGGLWSLPAIQEAHGDDFGVLPFPAIGAKGRPVVPFGAFGACVNAKSKQVDAAKDFVKWLWIDQEDKQIDFAASYGIHIPAKDALTDKTEQFKSGPGADAARFVAEHGFANDIMWSGPMGAAFNSAVNNVIVSGKDPKEAFASFGDLAKQELAKLAG